MLYMIKNASERLHLQYRELGSKLLLNALLGMVEAGAISPEEAIANADNRTDVRLRLRLAAGASLGGEGMQMAPEEPPPDEPPPTAHR